MMFKNGRYSSVASTLAFVVALGGASCEMKARVAAVPLPGSRTPGTTLAT